MLFLSVVRNSANVAASSFCCLLDEFRLPLLRPHPSPSVLEPDGHGLWGNFEFPSQIVSLQPSHILGFGEALLEDVQMSLGKVGPDTLHLAKGAASGAGDDVSLVVEGCVGRMRSGVVGGGRSESGSRSRGVAVDTVCGSEGDVRGRIGVKVRDVGVVASKVSYERMLLRMGYRRDVLFLFGERGCCRGDGRCRVAIRGRSSRGVLLCVSAGRRKFWVDIRVIVGGLHNLLFSVEVGEESLLFDNFFLDEVVDVGERFCLDGVTE